MYMVPIHRKSSQKFVRGLAILICLAALGACGEKLPLPSHIQDNPDGRLVDTVYLPITPVWSAADGKPYARPNGIAVGYDRTLYISDTDNDRIVRLDLAGNFIESFSVPHPVAVAQDRSFNLVCVGRSDTIWVRRHNEGGDFEPLIVADSVLVCVPVPRGGTVCAWEHSNFFDLAASPALDGWFFTIDESFNMTHRFSMEFPVLLGAIRKGLGPGEVALPLSIATGLSRDGYRIYVTQYDLIQGLQYFGSSRRRPIALDESADLFHLLPYGYKLVAADDLGNAYVLSHATSEVMKFNRHGRLLLRFGRQGDDIMSLKNPRDITVVDQTLYIADTDNNRIVRYRLATVPEG
jgi:hypothetical protein